MTLPRPAHTPVLASVACLMIVLTGCSPKPAPSAPTENNPATATSPESSTSPPSLTINREAGTLDLPAMMVHAKPDWLELIATTEGPNSRGHEAIVTINAKPSEIHLALLTLGLKPGHPMINKHVEGRFLPDPPSGPGLHVFFVYQVKGQTIQTPAHEWVIDQATGQPLADTHWLFTGSQFRQWQGKEYYMADENGNAVSLVNFGDDLIVRQTDTTQNNDGQDLQLNEAAALPYGTPLILRIQITPPPPTEADPSAVTP